MKYNVIYIQTTNEGTARAMVSFDTMEQAKSRAYTELAQISVSPTLKSVKVLVVDDNLNTILIEENSITATDEPEEA